MIKPKKLGYLVLRVRDRERSERFYTEVLGLRVTGRIAGAMTFFACGEDSHDLAIMKVGADAPGPDRNRLGLYHFAYQVDSPEALKEAYTFLGEKGVTLVGSADHGVSQGIYLLDPDGDEIEIYYERPPSQWPKEGNVCAGTAPLKLD